MAANAEIYFEHDGWGRALAWSAGLHVGITGRAAESTPRFSTGPNGDTWGAGGGGEAIGATLVSTVPLPANPAQTQNVLANESKGMTQSQPKVEEKEPDAIEIQGKNAKIKAEEKAGDGFEREAAGRARAGETIRWRSAKAARSAGLTDRSMRQTPRADSGSRGAAEILARSTAWYVHVIQQKVSDNWLKYEVDPRITSAQRVYITFDVANDGHPTNVQVEQSSGVPSLDISAVRALQRIDTFGPLPPDYSGNKISVEFWFDYKK